jgi:hypothetical protein
MIVRSGSEMQSACSVKVIDKERTLLTRQYTRMAYTFKYICRTEKPASDI